MGADFSGVLKGRKESFNPLTGQVTSEQVAEHKLQVYEDYQSSLENFGAPAAGDDDEKGNETDDDDEEFFNIYKGGIMIQAPTVIVAGEEADLSVSWSVPAAVSADQKSGSDGRRLYIATAAFTAMNEAAKLSGRRKKGAPLIEQPTLTKFTVETLDRQA
jgi:hypothetical protein